MRPKAQKAQQIRKGILWLISFVTVLSSVAQRDDGSRSAVVASSALPPARRARKLRACRPLSSLLVYKTSFVQTARPADSPAPCAKKRRSRNPTPSQPRAPESATTGFQDLYASRRNR